ncbi:hypothetical protein CVV43_00650 [Candidatus Saccharibacteria bacterium HGW-Saccharibacteria-1]|nr:MAG: hypothetical protein CVV43_00650 [Candidatus Saccharibacteria bacterium HGW-Saccharibacteria-1]
MVNMEIKRADDLKPSSSSSVRSMRGFTIVELLVVIVIIGILAAITIVSYTGLAKKATEASLVSGLDGAKKQLLLYQADHGYFPDHFNDNCPADSSDNIDSRYCLKPSSGGSYEYSSSSPKVYLLKYIKGDISYMINDNSSPTVACPAGFIAVPGSATYGTSDFCVMKYEAKDNGSGLPVSKYDTNPWVNISYDNSVTKSAAACSGCHLISEAEWMTIAQNLTSVADNWSGGSVGSGYIYSGHNDDAPAYALEASGDDGQGYYLETNTGGKQKRTLTLTNGEVIWDLAGNVYERTSGEIIGSQPGVIGISGYGWKEWSAVNNGVIPTVNPFPVNANALASTWNASSNGIGRLYSNIDETADRTFVRGGDWNYGTPAGIYSLNLDGVHGGSGDSSIGFRVAK